MTRRLEVGDRFRYDGEVYVVEMVTDCRARCRPLARRQVVLRPAGGDERAFEASGRSINISPYSDVTLVELACTRCGLAYEGGRVWTGELCDRCEGQEGGV